MSSVRYCLGRDFQPAAAYLGELEEALIHGGVDPGMIKSDVAQTTNQCKPPTPLLVCCFFCRLPPDLVDCFACEKKARFLLAAARSTGTAPHRARHPSPFAFFPFLCNTVSESPHATARNGWSWLMPQRWKHLHNSPKFLEGEREERDDEQGKGNR
jgi:hypothetical protein